MPTKADFDTASQLFRSAGESLGAITNVSLSADASQILRGGRLGSQVPARIAETAASVSVAQIAIEGAALLCIERAAIIANYEIQLDAYDLANTRFESSLQWWHAQYAAWWDSEDGSVLHPGPSPTPPIQPDSPPAWADVRRP